MDPKEFFGDNYIEFDEEDPFNRNQVKGYISRCPTDLYGAVLIDLVNGEKCPQLIKCTPKIHYPFNKKGEYNFPKAVKVERYEKLDGTNIFSYRYNDGNGNEYVTHKTRLSPFVGNSRFGPFLEMLRELFNKNPTLKWLPSILGMNISYELWGARNPHLIKYEIPLELSILFIRDNNRIMPPSVLNDKSLLSANLREVIIDGNLEDTYHLSQQGLEKNLKILDGEYSGMEGEVWYILTDDGIWHQFKCKPETIELIHWSMGGIGKNQIITTCENALENWDNPTVDDIVILLQEEYSQQEIDKIYYKIGKYLDYVIDKHIFVEEVLRDYRNINISILDNKSKVMKVLSSKYNRKDMQRVYSIIWTYTIN